MAKKDELPPDPSVGGTAGLNAKITQGVVDVMKNPDLMPIEFKNWLPQFVDLNMLQHGYRHRNTGPDPIPFPPGYWSIWAHAETPAGAAASATTATSSWSQIRHEWTSIGIEYASASATNLGPEFGDVWAYATSASPSYTLYLTGAGMVHVSVRVRWAGPNYFSNPTLPFATGIRVDCDAETSSGKISGGTQTRAGPTPENDWQTLSFVADYGVDSATPAAINVYTAVASASAIPPSEVRLDIGRLNVPVDPALTNPNFFQIP